MLRSPLAKLCGILLLLANLWGLNAQQTISKVENLSNEVDANWKALQIQAKGLSPEARIAAVDLWQRSQQPKLDALKQAGKQAALQASAHAVPVPLPSPAPTTELGRINAAIEKEFQLIRDAKLSPEERIRQVDVAMIKTSSMQVQREGLLCAVAVSAKVALPPTNPISLDPKSLEGRLAAKRSEMFEETKYMTPEDRIAVIDIRKNEIDSLSREVRAASISAIPVQEKPTNSETVP